MGKQCLVENKCIHWLVKKLKRKKSLEGYRYRMMDRGDGGRRKKPAVPKGCFPVEVGEEHRRYVIPVACLSSIRFQTFLDEYEAEIHDMESKAITLPCSIFVFETVLSLVKAENRKLRLSLD